MSIRRQPPPIVITQPDHDRLSTLADAARRSSLAADELAEELGRARVVRRDEISPTIVTMHSRFVFKDQSSADVRTASLVYPGEENIDDGRISILTPIGTALLGLSEGQSIEWETRTGVPRTLTVLKVLSQPVPSDPSS